MGSGKILFTKVSPSLTMESVIPPKFFLEGDEQRGQVYEQRGQVYNVYMCLVT
jgi:hypothetical protein